jgi:hypothetical protein
MHGLGFLTTWQLCPKGSFQRKRQVEAVLPFRSRSHIMQAVKEKGIDSTSKLRDAKILEAWVTLEVFLWPHFLKTQSATQKVTMYLAGASVHA